MSEYASDKDKNPERGGVAELADSNSVTQLDEAAVRRLVRKTDLILMPPLGK